MVDLKISFLVICLLGSFAAAFAPVPLSRTAVVTARLAHEAEAAMDAFKTVIAEKDSAAVLSSVVSNNRVISAISMRKHGLDTLQAMTSPTEADPFQGVPKINQAAASPITPQKTAIFDLSAWKRRLDTRQDKFNIHKWAGLGWWLSSTVIFGAGAMSGFTEVPEVLGPITYLFLLSTAVQSMSSIPMAIKYRQNDPSVQRAFISAAITSSSLAFLGYWLSPFAQNSLRPELAAGFIALFLLIDSIYSMTSFEDMKVVLAEIKNIDPIKEAQALPEMYTKLIGLFPIGLPMNAMFLQQMYAHLDDVRAYFLAGIISRGSSTELVYYTLMVTSIAVCIGSLASTLRHRKLISQDVENLAAIGSLVVTLVFSVKAAGTF